MGITIMLRTQRVRKDVKDLLNLILICKFNLNVHFEHFSKLVRHLLFSGDPFCWSYCHCHQPGKPRRKKVEYLKNCCEDTDEEHNHVEDTEGQKAGGKRDKLYMLIKIVRWVVCVWAMIHC